ncbi:MAG: hypothetical protein HWN65_21915 [Candidatus Helarchaeota archaeon]|nr:hypothetical protein [Candidatus Helarchaeota archaeon]
MMELTERQLNLLIAFPIFIAIAIILGLLILRRDPKYWGNRLFFLSFTFNGLALLFNLFYLFSQVKAQVITLNIISILMINIATISMVLAILVLYRGENAVIGSKTTLYFLIAVIIVLTIHVLLPGGVSTRTTVSVPPEIVPLWGLHFGIYQMVFSEVMFIAVYYISIKLYKELSDEMKRKFKRFLFGGVFINLTLLSVSIDNMYIFANYEIIGGLLNLGALIGVILIYYGIVRK